MRQASYAIRLGLQRGLIVYRQITFSREGLFNVVFWYGIPVLLFVLFRDESVPGTDLSLGAALMPAMCTVLIAISAINPAFYLSTEREDGTLLRARAVPHGLVGYITGVLTYSSIDAIVGLVIVVGAGLALLPGLEVTGLDGWATFVVVVVLGLLAVLPLGIVDRIDRAQPARSRRSDVAGRRRRHRDLGRSSLRYRIWPAGCSSSHRHCLSTGSAWGCARSSCPKQAVVLEIGESWRRLEMVAVLATYAVVGALVAQVVLRRMARRESGSAVEARRQEAMQRV